MWLSFLNPGLTVDVFNSTTLDGCSLHLLWRRGLCVRPIVSDPYRTAAPTLNPQARDVAKREADQSHHQRPLLDLLRNRFGGATTRINDVLHHPARLRPGLLCRVARVAQHFSGLTGRFHGSRGSILNYFLGVAGCGGGRSRGALNVLADCFSGLYHARLHAPWIIRRRIAHHGSPYDVLLARELLLRGSRGGSARSVFELWQDFEPFLGAARQCHLFVGESQRLVRDDNQASAHAQEAADRQHCIWLLAVAADEEGVARTDGFVGIVDDAAANDLGRAITGRQLLHIDFDEFYRLRRALCSGAAGENRDADDCRTGENH